MWCEFICMGARAKVDGLTYRFMYGTIVPGTGTGPGLSTERKTEITGERPSPSFFIVNWGSDAERKSVATRAAPGRRPWCGENGPKEPRECRRPSLLLWPPL